MNNFPTFTLLKYKIIFAVSILFLMGCKTKQAASSNSKENNIKHLEGMIKKEDLKKAPHIDWYNEHYNEYKVDTEALGKLKTETHWKHNVQVMIYMGTWCHDSKVQVTRMLKIFESLGYENYSIIALDTDKKSEKGYELNQNIIRVPTFVFIENRNEINRIIETPVKSLEEDLVSILLTKDYTPHSFD